MNYNLETITLKNQTINLAMPKNFSASQKYRVYFVFDGQQLLANPETNILSNANNIIFVGLNNLNDAARFNNLSTFVNHEVKPLMTKYFPELENNENNYLGGQAQATIDFIEVDLLPWLQQEKKIEYHDLNLLGCSMGAYFSLQMLYLSKLIFKTVYLLSPSIWFNQDILEDLKTQTLNHQQKLNVNLWVGLKEAKLFEKVIATNYYQDALLVKEVLETQQLQVKFFVDANGSHGFKWWINFINHHPELY